MSILILELCDNRSYLFLTCFQIKYHRHFDFFYNYFTRSVQLCDGRVFFSLICLIKLVMDKNLIFDADGQADTDCIEKSEKISAEECGRSALAMDEIKRL